MLIRQVFAASIVTAFVGVAAADEIRYYEQDGVIYRETRQVIQRPVYETQLQPTTRTVYREQAIAECRDTARVVWTPVTQYRYQSYLVGQGSPCAVPCYATYCVPETRWEQRTETVKVPLVSRRWVPQTETVQTPVTSQRLVSQEVVSRAIVGRVAPLAAASAPIPTSALAATSTSTPTAWPAASAQNVAPAWSAPSAPAWPQYPAPVAPSEQIGGVARLTQDPPRYGVSFPAPPPTTVR